MLAIMPRSGEPGVVVVAAAIVRDGAVLACRRRDGAYAGRWEFPGGKVEPGEDEQTALRRECREELGLDVTPVRRIGPDTSVGVGVLRLWIAGATGDPVLRVHDEIAWCTAADVGDRPWIPADLGLVAEVRELLA